MESTRNERSLVGRLVRGLVYGAILYVITLIIMPASALGLTPAQMVPACVVVGVCLALYVTRRK